MKVRIENTSGSSERFGEKKVVSKQRIQKELNVRIYADEDPVAGLRRAWGAAVALAEECHEGPMRGGPQEVHFLRLTVKRLRSYLQLARADLDPAEFRNENHFLRDVGRSLAGNRDAIMTLRTVDRLELFAKGDRERRALGKLKRRLEPGEAGMSQWGVETGAQLAARAIGKLQESVVRFELVRKEAKGWGLMESGLNRVYLRAEKQFVRWRKSGDAEKAHLCRRFSKYLGFHLELLDRDGSKKVRRLRDHLSDFQRRLGRMNDVVMLGERVDVMASEGKLGRKAEKRVRRVLARARKQLGRECRKAGSEVFASRELPDCLLPGPGREMGLD